MRWNRQPGYARASRALLFAATMLALGGCNTLGGALMGAVYLGAETGSVEGLLGGAIVGAGIGLAADVETVLHMGHPDTQEDVAEYYYPCRCEQCRRAEGQR